MKRTLLVVALICNAFFVLPQQVRITYNKTIPQQQYAFDRLKKALEKKDMLLVIKLHLKYTFFMMAKNKEMKASPFCPVKTGSLSPVVIREA